MVPKDLSPWYHAWYYYRIWRNDGTWEHINTFVRRDVCIQAVGWLDWSRILGKEYERTTESSESDIYLASIRLMLRRLAHAPR